MARRISSIENEILRTEMALKKAKEKCNVLSTKLLSLHKQHQDYETQQVSVAFLKSGKSVQDIIEFLGYEDKKTLNM